MGAFYDKFRELLERRPEPPFEKRLWEKLDESLDAQEGKRRNNAALLWCAAALMVLLLGSNVFLLSKLKNAQWAAGEITHQYDTVYQTKVVYQTDTLVQAQIIYRDRYEKNPVKHVLVAEFKNTLPDFSNIDQSYSILSTLNTPNHHAPISLGITNEHTARLSNLPIDVLTKRRVRVMATESPSIPDLADMPEKQEKRRLGQRLYQLLPDDVYFGIGGGLARPHVDGLTSVFGYSAYTETAVQILPNWRVYANIAYQNTRFKSFVMDPDMGVPVIDPPAEGFVFQSAEFTQPAMDFDIGLQYVIRPDRMIRPYVGIGYGGLIGFRSELTYDFEDAGGIEAIIERRSKAIGWSGNIGFAHVGLEYDLREHLSLTSRITYRAHLSSEDFERPSILGIRLGLRVDL